RRPDLDIEGAVDAIVERAMAKAPEARYASSDELRGALEAAPHLTSGRIEDGALEGKRREADRIDPGMASPEARLKREDVDHYERSVRRRRWVGLALVPLVLALVAAAVAWTRVAAERPREVEEEPNDTPEQATPIGNDHTVRGHLGPAAGDRDLYRFTVGRGAH